MQDLTSLLSLQGNPTHAVIGTERKPKKEEERPGPGQHDPNPGAARPRARGAVIPKDQSRHGYLNKDSARNPGPGAYADADGTSRAGSGARGQTGGAFSLDRRETAFDRIHKQGGEVPGAGNYDPAGANRTQGSSFAHGKRPEPGQAGSSLPGPGAYNAGGADGAR